MYTYRIETTSVPRSISSLDFFNAHPVSSSMDDSFNKYHNIFQQLAIKGRNNDISVGDCGMSTVNLSDFIACLGMTVQKNDHSNCHFYGNPHYFQRLPRGHDCGRIPLSVLCPKSLNWLLEWCRFYFFFMSVYLPSNITSSEPHSVWFTFSFHQQLFI